MRYHDITPGTNFNQIRAEFNYIIANNIEKRFFGYMCNDCWKWGQKKSIINEIFRDLKSKVLSNVSK